MVQLKSMQVTLPARDVKAAARFYREVLGFRILTEGPNCISLAQGDFRLSLIKAEPGLATGTPPVQLRFTVSAPQYVDEVAERVKQLNIPVLEDVRQQSDGTRAFTCLGPDEHVIEIGTELSQPLSVEPITETKPTTVELPASPSQAPVQSPVTPPGRPTRGDRYLLEAQERLAKIKEELASLSTAFSQTDIAATLDEMKQKVARRVIEAAEKVATPTEQEADRQQKQREAEEALARYKQKIAGEPEPTAKPKEEALARSKPEVGGESEAAKPQEAGLKPVRKTLGPAPGDKPPRE